MDLRHVEYLFALAEELHFRRAAERLLISQSSLSYHVKQVEAEVGTRLFRRDRRGVALTPAGAAFVERSRRALAEADLAVREARRAGGKGNDNLTVGANATLFGRVVPRIMHSLDADVPGLRTTWESLTPAEAVEALRSLRVDAAITTTQGVPVPDELVTVILLRVPLRLAVPKDHRLAKLRRVPLASLAQEQTVCIVDSTGGVTAEFVRRLCRAAGVRTTISQEAEGMQVALALVAAEKGVAVVPATAQALHCNGVTYKPLEDVSEQMSFDLVWRRDRTTDALASFRQSAVNALALPGSTVL